MPRYISHEHQFLLYTNRKCATMSVKAWVRNSRGRVTGAGRREYLRYPEYVRAAIVRNPFDRIIASWGRAKCTYHPETGGRFGTFTQDIWGTTRVHLERFLQQCRDVPDPHWRPQWNSLVDSGGMLIPTVLIRMERMQSEWDSFCELVGLPPGRFPRENSHQMHSSPLKLRQYDHYRDYFTPQARQLVEEIYRLDLELLGYAFEGEVDAPAKT